MTDTVSKDNVAASPQMKSVTPAQKNCLYCDQKVSPAAQKRFGSYCGAYCYAHDRD